MTKESLKLNKPIRIGGVDVDKIEIQNCTLGDMKMAGVNQFTELDDFDKFSKLVGYLTCSTPEELNAADMRDWTAISNKVCSMIGLDTVNDEIENHEKLSLIVPLKEGDKDIRHVSFSSCTLKDIRKIGIKKATDLHDVSKFTNAASVITNIDPNTLDKMDMRDWMKVSRITSYFLGFVHQANA